jgi:hypothetical protein
MNSFIAKVHRFTNALNISWRLNPFLRSKALRAYFRPLAVYAQGGVEDGEEYVAVVFRKQDWRQLTSIIDPVREKKVHGKRIS